MTSSGADDHGHREWMGQQVQLTREGIEIRNPGLLDLLEDERYSRFRNLFPAFLDVLGHEGGSAGVNTYDNQGVTIGAGYSMEAGAGQSVLARLPAGMTDRLHAIGVHSGPGGTGEVRVVSRFGEPRVLTGGDALEALRLDRLRSAFLQQLQSSDDSFEGSDHAGEPTEMEGRDWALRANIAQLCDNNMAMPPSAESWSRGEIHLALQLKHWHPSNFTWSDYDGVSGDRGHVGAQIIIHFIRGTRPHRRSSWPAIRERIAGQQGGAIRYQCNWSEVDAGVPGSGSS